MPILGQEGVSALSLDRLSVLERHTQVLAVPTMTPDETLPVRVPLLGVYVLQKAATFTNRSAPHKAAKDLLYIRDVLAAGSTVLTRVAGEIGTVIATDPQAADLARTAMQSLDLVVGSRSHALLASAARMRREREPAIKLETAVAELEGRLRDAIGLVRTSARGTRTSRRHR
jgi:hypothetical protein